MSKPLEEYLAVVTKSLWPLSVARRDEELRELRQHLQSAVTVNQESGQTETDAVATALEQFGTPSEVGRSIVWAWRRDAAKKQRKSYFEVVTIWSFFLAFEHFYLPHHSGPFIPSFCLHASIMFGWTLKMFLPLKYTPAWLVLECGPIGLTWSRLITAFTVIVCAVGVFSMPHPPGSYYSFPYGDVALIVIYWYVRCETVAKELRQD